MPQRLGEPHVPDPRDDALVDERLTDEARSTGSAKPRDDLLQIRVSCKQVWTEPIDDAASEAEHRTVPLCCLPLRAAQDEPRRTSPRRVAKPANAPAAAHPQVAVDDDSTFEVQQHVLAHRLDALEQLAVDGSRDAGREAARVRALGRDPLADQDLQALRSAMERVTLGHVR